MPIQKINSTDLISVSNTSITGTITGSQISANTVTSTNLQTGSLENYMSSQGFALGMRNRIINGAMMIDQRNAGASVNINTSNIFGVDRWKFDNISSSTMTAQQSSTAPTGFANSSVVTVGTGASVGSSGYVRIIQNIEGFNTADLMWGTANAQTVTISFWVRSSIAGTYCFGLQNATTAYSYPVNYTISAANTWEQKTITVAGPTSGTWVGATNGIGILCTWDLGSGSNWNGTNATWQSANAWKTSSQTAWSATSGATFYITGVQLEKGATATPFENRLYGAELTLCQRYYELCQGIGMSLTVPNTSLLNYQEGVWFFKATKRTTPTTGFLASTSLSGVLNSPGVGAITPLNASGGSSSTDSCIIYTSTSGSYTVGQLFQYIGAPGFYASAEL